ncbi:MAG: signal peptidase II [Microbacteriaceae bacterium]
MKHRSLVILTIALAAFWIVVDQLSKFLAVEYLEPGIATPLIGDLFQLRLVYNPGAAFGLGTGYTWILTVIAGAVAIGLGFLVMRVRRLDWALVVGSMLGGAISHFFDRLLREPAFANGHIVDFLDYGGFFVGNIADIALVGAAIGAVLLSFFGVPFSEPEHREPVK